jgi:hypothetical protein
MGGFILVALYRWLFPVYVVGAHPLTMSLSEFKNALIDNTPCIKISEIPANRLVSIT